LVEPQAAAPGIRCPDGFQTKPRKRRYRKTNMHVNVYTAVEPVTVNTLHLHTFFHFLPHGAKPGYCQRVLYLVLTICVALPYKVQHWTIFAQEVC